MTNKTIPLQGHIHGVGQEISNSHQDAQHQEQVALTVGMDLCGVKIEGFGLNNIPQHVSE